MELVRKARRRRSKIKGSPIKNEGLAVLHNELARCHVDMSVTAMRLILIMADQVRRDGEFKPMLLRVEDYKQRLNLKGKSAYHHLWTVILKLMKTVLITEHPVEGEDAFQVLAPSRRIPKKGEFMVRFNDQMKPLLLGLNRLFCQIPLEVFFRIQGAYAVRFYLLCKSLDPERNENLNGWRMTVDELRDWLQIQDGQYEELFNLRAAVLKRAQRELDEVADLSFRFEPITKGRQTIGWNFTVVTNRPKVLRDAVRPVGPETPAHELSPERAEEELAKGRAILAELKAKIQGAA